MNWFKDKKVIGSILAIVVIILAIWLLIGKPGCNKTEIAKLETAAKVDSSAYWKIESQFKDSLNRIYRELLAQRGDCHKKNVNMPQVVYRYKQPVKKVYQQQVQQPVQQPVYQQPVYQQPVQKIQTSENRSENRLDNSYYEPNSKAILFCIRLGQNENRHLPHLAIDNSEKFDNSEENNLAGYNWRVYKLADGFVGNYGVTADGTFFISKAYIDRYMCADDNGKVELKTTKSHWRAVQMTLSGNYYIHKF